MNDLLTSAFAGAAADVKTPFMEKMALRFDETTACKVLEIFQKLGLPPPEEEDEYLRGTEGNLIFLSRYGVVIRLENKADIQRHWKDSSRVSDSVWILKALASIDASEVNVEICPGCHVGKKWEDLQLLHRYLGYEDISFRDDQYCNFGTIPVSTVRFPDGVPIVIDRGAVGRLGYSVSSVKDALEKKWEEEICEAEAVQKSLYEPLRQAFAEAWPDPSGGGQSDPQKIADFWRLCEEYTKEGKLVAGWDEAGAEGKTSQAATAAKNYEKRLRSVSRLCVQAYRQLLNRFIH